MPPREGDGIRQQFLQLPRQDIEGCGFGRGRRPALLDPSIGHLPDLPVRTIPVSEVPACHPVGAAGGADRYDEPSSAAANEGDGKSVSNGFLVGGGGSPGAEAAAPPVPELCQPFVRTRRERR